MINRFSARFSYISSRVCWEKYDGRMEKETLKTYLLYYIKREYFKIIDFKSA